MVAVPLANGGLLLSPVEVGPGPDKKGNTTEVNPIVRLLPGNELPQAVQAHLESLGTEVKGVIDVHSHPFHDLYGRAEPNAATPSGVYGADGVVGGDVHGFAFVPPDNAGVVSGGRPAGMLVVTNDAGVLGDDMTLVRRGPMTAGVQTSAELSKAREKAAKAKKFKITLHTDDLGDVQDALPPGIEVLTSHAAASFQRVTP